MPGPLQLRGSAVVPESELRWRFSRSSGPGGQSVNTTDSRVELSFDVAASTAFGPTLRSRALERLAGRLVDGVVTVAASEQRSQWQNRLAAEERLRQLLLEATAPPPKVRRPTRPSRGAVNRRIDAKKQRGQTKRLRGNDFDEVALSSLRSRASRADPSDRPPAWHAPPWPAPVPLVPATGRAARAGAPTRRPDVRRRAGRGRTPRPAGRRTAALELEPVPGVHRQPVHRAPVQLRQSPGQVTEHELVPRIAGDLDVHGLQTGQHQVAAGVGPDPERTPSRQQRLRWAAPAHRAPG